MQLFHIRQRVPLCPADDLNVVGGHIDQPFHIKIQLTIRPAESGGNLLFLGILPERLLLPLAELQSAVRQDLQAAVVRQLVLAFGFFGYDHKVDRCTIAEGGPVITGKAAVQDIQFDSHLLQGFAQGGIFFLLGTVRLLKLEVFHRQMLYGAVCRRLLMRVLFGAGGIEVPVVDNAEQRISGPCGSLLQRYAAVPIQLPTQLRSQCGGSIVANGILQIDRHFPQSCPDAFHFGGSHSLAKTNFLLQRLNAERQIGRQL